MATPNWMSPRVTPGIVSPDDWILESISEATSGAGASTVTLLTDTIHINNVKFAIPVPTDATPTAVNNATVGATFVFNGENSTTYRVYIIGGAYTGSQAFRLLTSQRPARPGSLYWEIISKTADGSGDITITYASDLNIAKPEVIIPVNTMTTGNASANFRAISVTDIGATVATLKTATVSHTCSILIGGYLDSGYASEAESNHPFLLEGMTPGRKHPGDLVGEVVTKTLSSASPSSVTLTASSDCAFVRIIKAVIPIDTDATLGSVGAVVAAGGATATIYGPNTVTHIVRCLVLGYAL